MRGEMLSILALYKYDPTIFSGLTLPDVSELNPTAELIDPIEPLDKDLLIGNILSELAELSLVYTDPDTLRPMIEIWSKLSHRVWLQLWETLLYKYNPIWNKDGKITETRELTKDGTEAGTQDDSTATSSQSSYNSTLNNNVTGYDTNSYSPNTQDVGNGSSSASASGSLDRDTSSQYHHDEEEHYTRIERGNIGVTTTQQMLKEQREVVEFNIYHYITESFKERFCVMVY